MNSREEWRQEELWTATGREGVKRDMPDRFALGITFAPMTVATCYVAAEHESLDH